MPNLSETTIRYIDIFFQPELKPVIYSGFNILEAFGVQFFEDKYVDLISRYDTINSDSKRDSFLFMLKKDILGIIQEHFIELNTDMDLELRELNEIAHFLYIIQNLEDYSWVIYRLASNDNNKNIFISLMCHVTIYTSEIRLREIVGKVDDKFIDTLRAYIESEHESMEEVIDIHRLKYIQTFFKFINNHECLGRTLYDQGYTNMTLKELLDVLDFDVAAHIDNLVMTDLPQAALDVLSMLIITSDQYNLPILKYNQSTFYFTTHMENVTKLIGVITQMVSDFSLFLDATNAAGDQGHVNPV